MSNGTDPLKQITFENYSNPICGVVSAMSYWFEALPVNDRAAWVNKDLKKGERSKLPWWWFEHYLSVMEELKKQKRGKQVEDRVKSIETFTRSFGGEWTNWKWDGFVTEIRDCSDVPEPIRDGAGLALPPMEVIEVLRLVTGKGQVQLIEGECNSAGVVGLAQKSRKEKELYDGLAHYIYRQEDGTIYSWGNKYKNLEELNEAQGNKGDDVLYELFTIVVKK
ncbi:MAG: hypothetical protein F6J93_34790 [Oscillatoria sp. SIO1A7]|nr:hypothetical protein [Oscillatoria sp. SIO1A7]